MQAIMVKKTDSGTYEIPGAAEVEDWDAVRRECDSVGAADALVGWGRWTEVYEVECDGDAGYYFVGCDAACTVATKDVCV